MRRRLPFIDMDLDAAELLATVEQHGGRVADASYQSNALLRAPLKLPADMSEVDQLCAEQRADRTHDDSYAHVAIRAMRLLGLPWSPSMPVLVSSVLRWARGVLTELVARERELENALAARASEQAVYATRLQENSAARKTMETQHAQALAFERSEAAVLAEKLHTARAQMTRAEQVIEALHANIAELTQEVALAEVRLAAAEGRAEAAERALAVAERSTHIMATALRVPPMADTPAHSNTPARSRS